MRYTLNLYILYAYALTSLKYRKLVYRGIYIIVVIGKFVLITRSDGRGPIYSIPLQVHTVRQTVLTWYYIYRYIYIYYGVRYERV